MSAWWQHTNTPECILLRHPLMRIGGQKDWNNGSFSTSIQRFPTHHEIVLGIGDHGQIERSLPDPLTTTHQQITFEIIACGMKNLGLNDQLMAGMGHLIIGNIPKKLRDWQDNILQGVRWWAILASVWKSDSDRSKPFGDFELTSKTTVSQYMNMRIWQAFSEVTQEPSRLGIWMRVHIVGLQKTANVQARVHNPVI